MLDHLTQQLQQVLPSALLQVTSLPENPEIRLALLNADYPQGELSPDEVRHCMDNPLWQYSLEVYSREGVETRRLALGRPEGIGGCAGRSTAVLYQPLAGPSMIPPCSSCSRFG